jgi:hypothetical protein
MGRGPAEIDNLQLTRDLQLNNRFLLFVGLAVYFLSILGNARAEENRTLPPWISEAVGSPLHPIGVASMYVRCPWAGIFPPNGGWAAYAGRVDLSNEQTVQRLDASIEIFNKIASQNSFYRKSGGRNVDWSVLRPATHYLTEVASRWPPPPRREEYESTAHFADRQRDWRVRFERRLSVIVRNEILHGPSGLPAIDDRSRDVRYDADKKVFVADLRSVGLKRTERLIRYNPATNKDTTEETNVELTINTRGLAPLTFSATRQDAQKIHPHLVLIATGTVSVNPTGWNMIIHIDVDQIEIRDICNNEVLALISVDLKK